MSKRPSMLAVLAPLFLLLVAGFAYYAKYHWARAWVDGRYPWIKENIGSRLPALVIQLDSEGAPAKEAEPVGQEKEAVVNAWAQSSQIANERAQNPLSTNTADGHYVSADGVVNLTRLAEDRAAWPKTVKLRKRREFPAIVNGKQVGKVEAPSGSEARLVAVQSGKLGLEFRGGGAWVTVEDTDLAARLRSGNQR